ncbi:MAG: carboxypeptidase regulatory-like domain-containing protein, partial [Endomicrobium sp.]|nr:carboxypeptidase regulatory-like domain-containing protein [Endomicrobium sp.]
EKDKNKEKENSKDKKPDVKKKAKEKEDDITSAKEEKAKRERGAVRGRVTSQKEERSVVAAADKKEEKKLKAEREKPAVVLAVDKKEEKKLKAEQEKLKKEQAAEAKKRNSSQEKEPDKKPEKKEPPAKKEKMVKVKGKIESKIAGPLKDIELSMSHGFSVKTDEKGKYEFLVPAGKRYTLNAESSDFYFEPQKVVYDELKSNAVQDFVPYVMIEGEAFAEGKGVPDVQINMNGSQVTSTNQFGKYKIEKIDYGSPVTIVASKNGVNFYPGMAQIPSAVKNMENVNFMASYSIIGKVNIQGGNAGLGNVSIEVKGSTKTIVSTDFGGNFMVLGLEQGGSFEITPTYGGYSFTPPSRKFLNIKESMVGQNFSALKETYTVRGNVNIGGKPIRNAVVSISKRALKYYTDDEGNFHITNLDYGGPYNLTASSSDHEFEPIVIEVLDKDTDIEFSTDISLGGIVLSGNKPVADVIVDVNGRKHKTDANGHYLIKGLKYNGDYLLSLSAQGIMFSPSQKEYTGVKKSILNETFNASALINGRVTFNGKPLGGASIKISGDLKEYKSDSNGYFLIKDLKLGEDYTLDISNPGYKFDPPKREYKNLTSSKMTEHFKASLSGLYIKGKVTADGNPLKKVTVVIEGTAKSQTITDDQGQFMFEGLAANKRYELTVLSKLHRFETPSAIIEDMDSDMEIEIEPGTISSGVSISGSKTAAQERATRVFYKVNGKVTLNGEALGNVSIRSKAENVSSSNSGEYTISVKAGDSIEIRPFLEGYVFTPDKYVLKDIKASASNMNFAARENTHTLSGRIVNKDSKGIKGISLKERNSSDDFMTDSKGSYKIAGLAHRADGVIVPDSQDYDFYPKTVEIYPENDFTLNDIYAYPKKIKKAEAFIYGGINSVVNITESRVSIIIVSPENGRVSVKIKDNKDNIVKEFEPNVQGGKVLAVDWDGRKSTGADALPGNYSAELNGAGFKGEVLNFRVAE